MIKIEKVNLPENFSRTFFEHWPRIEFLMVLVRSSFVANNRNQISYQFMEESYNFNFVKNPILNIF